MTRMAKPRISFVAAILFILIVGRCTNWGQPQEIKITVTATAVNTATPEVTPFPTQTSSPTATATLAPTSFPTSTTTPTAEPTSTYQPLPNYSGSDGWRQLYTGQAWVRVVSQAPEGEMPCVEIWQSTRGCQGETIEVVTNFDQQFYLTVKDGNDQIIQVITLVPGEFYTVTIPENGSANFGNVSPN
jgi:hypothetical protein